MALNVAPTIVRRASGTKWDSVALDIFAGAVFFFLLLPLLIVFPISFSASPYLQFPPPGYSLRWYESYLSDPSWIDATLRSLKVALCTTVFATLFGTLIALGLVRGQYPGRRLLEKVAVAPLIVPTMVYSVAVYSLFSQFRLIGDWAAIAIAHTVHAIPFVVLIVAASLRTFDVSLELAAMGLGAQRWRAIWLITIPQIRPAIFSAAFIAFISSFDELVIAMFLGGSNMTLQKKIFDNILYEIDPTVAAVSVLQILLVCITLLLVYRFGTGAKSVL